MSEVLSCGISAMGLFCPSLEILSCDSESYMYRREGYILVFITAIFSFTTCCDPLWLCCDINGKINIINKSISLSVPEVFLVVWMYIQKLQPLSPPFSAPALNYKYLASHINHCLTSPSWHWNTWQKFLFFFRLMNANTRLFLGSIVQNDILDILTVA